MYVYLQDILRELVKNDDEILIDLEPLKEAISASIVIKTHPVFYVLQDSCTSDNYDQQLMKNFKGKISLTAFLRKMFKCDGLLKKLSDATTRSVSKSVSK